MGLACQGYCTTIAVLVNELFGVPMEDVMRVLLALLGVAIAMSAWVLLRHRVLVVIALRNARRRATQTGLIIVGLMLSTLIISVALVIGDTVQYSIADRGIEQLASVDELVQPQAAGPSATPHREASDIADELRTSPGVDGAVPLIRGSLPAQASGSGVSTRAANIVGVDEERMAGFPDVISSSGTPLSVAGLADDALYADESLAAMLDVAPGDRIVLVRKTTRRSFTVQDVVRDRTLTGATTTEAAGLVMKLAEAQAVLGRDAAVDAIAISNSGGAHDGLQTSALMSERIDRRLSTLGEDQWRAEATKHVLAEKAASTASHLTAFFAVLGLFEIASGILLVFLVFVMLASERKMELGVMRAIGTQRQHLVQTFLIEGMVYNVPAAALGSGLGLAASMAIVRIMSGLFDAFGLSIVFHATVRSLVIAYSAGVVLTFLTTLGASWRVSELNIVEAIRGLPASCTRTGSPLTLALAAPLLLVGALLAAFGVYEAQTLAFMLGLTATLVGLAFVARFISVPRRPLSTGTGALVAVMWPLAVGHRVPLLSGLDIGVDTFVVAGFVMICATTLVLIDNSDVLLRLLMVAGRWRSRLLPSMRTAAAYPQVHRSRTGLTIALISLVVFSLVLMAAMNANFGRMFLGKDATGGYDLMVQASSSTPIPDLRAALSTRGYDTSSITAVHRIRIDGTPDAQLREAGSAPFARYPAIGMSPSFIASNGLKLQSEARGFADEGEVWAAIAQHSDYAVIDASVLSSGQFSLAGTAPFSLHDPAASSGSFTPFPLEVHDAATGKTATVTVIGIVTLKAAQTFRGVFVTDRVFDDVYGSSGTTYDLVQLSPGTDSRAASREIAQALVLQGAEIRELRQIVEDNQAFSQGLLYLSEAFMGVGLLVGISAMGLIAFRTVIERRQQIGMLRAIGFTRTHVALTLALESSFVALLGVASGVVLGLLLASQIVQSNLLSGSVGGAFYVPWLQVGGIALVAFLASLIMTIAPARRAGSIEIAEALRAV